MSEQPLVKPDRTFADHRNEIRPKLGDWYWVKIDKKSERSWKDGDAPKKKEMLLCVYKLFSNHVEFRDATMDGQRCFGVRYRDLLAEVRPEPNWKQITESRIAVKREELQEAVKQLAYKMSKAGVIEDAAPVETLLPSVARKDPKAVKRELVRLKKTDYPKMSENIETITKQITALHKDLIMPMRAETNRMEGAMESVDERLFALELYAGLWQDIKQIGDGAPAPEETTITVRQMMRFMDEECLIDYDKGGMDFRSLKRFDEWVAKPENRNRIAPEQRCVVALQIRRHMKDYGTPSSIGHALRMMEDHTSNEWTYLLIRNGDKLFRLTPEIDFKPRLLPLRDEFHKPFTNETHMSNAFNKKDDEEYRSWTEEEAVSPDDFEYDEHVEKLRKKVFEYNRVMFLIQGMLDRSQAFHPHPPINLFDQGDFEKWVQLNFDEETGLPSANPPKWDQYRDKANAIIKKDSLVWCGEPEDEYGGYTRDNHRPKYGYNANRRPIICKVSRVSRDRKKVWLRWELGNRITERWEIDVARPVPKKPGYYYQKKVETNHGMRYGIQKVAMEAVFNVEAYKRGEYKMFLCDAYLKGEYLEWAPQLLGAEKWHMERKTQQTQ